MYDDLDDLDDAFDALLDADAAGSPADAPSAAQQRLAQIQRERGVIQRRMRWARWRNQWALVSDLIGRLEDLDREEQQLRTRRSVYRFDGFDGFDDHGSEAFIRVLRVLSGPRSAAGTPSLRTGGSIGGAARLRQLWNTTQGLFLRGANEGQARQWAQREASRVGGRVVHDAPHIPGGRPHFHIERPGGERSGHIFYGAVPGGLFFEADY